MTAANDNATADGMELAAFDRHDGRVRVVLSKYKGKPQIQVRHWFYDSGTWHPTKRGVVFKARDLGVLIASLMAAYDALFPRGDDE